MGCELVESPREEPSGSLDRGCGPIKGQQCVSRLRWEAGVETRVSGGSDGRQMGDSMDFGRKTEFSDLYDLENDLPKR